MDAKWDLRFLKLAKEIASYSKDPSTQVGAVITYGNEIVSTGYNGLPRKIADDPAILNDRPSKLKRMIHAEVNAIFYAKRDLSNHTMYVWPFMPCGLCSSYISQVGITRVVSVVNDNERWKEDFEVSKDTLCRSEIELVEYFKNLEDFS